MIWFSWMREGLKEAIVVWDLLKTISSRERGRHQSYPSSLNNIRGNGRDKGSSEASQENVGFGAIRPLCEQLRLAEKWSTLILGNTHWLTWGRGPPFQSSAPEPSGRAGNQCPWPERGWWKILQGSEKCLCDLLGQSPDWRGHLLHLLVPGPESLRCWNKGVWINRKQLWDIG